MACAATRLLCAARFVSPRPGLWELASAAPYNPAPGVGAPGTAGGLEGEFHVGGGYAGCPRCGATSYVKCGRCEQLSCWRSESPMSTCGACGNVARVGGQLTTVQRVD